MAKANHQDLLLDWLRGAYMMEATLLEILEEQATRSGEFPILQQRLKEHSEQTQRHKALVKDCILRLNGDVPSLRADLSKIIGGVQSKMMGFFKDSLIKDLMASAASEELEIATYKSIIRLATRLGHGDIAQICQEILEEEETMLHFLNDQIDPIIDEAYERQILLN